MLSKFPSSGMFEVHAFCWPLVGILSCCHRPSGFGATSSGWASLAAWYKMTGVIIPTCQAGRLRWCTLLLTMLAIQRVLHFLVKLNVTWCLFTPWTKLMPVGWNQTETFPSTELFMVTKRASNIIPLVTNKMCWIHTAWEQSVTAELFDGHEIPFIALTAYENALRICLDAAVPTWH